MTSAAIHPLTTNVAMTRSRALTWFCVLLFGCGAVSRLAPLLDQGGRLLRQFPTEDGYLMLTIARNIALGNGMSTAAGTIPTNGTQPFCTFLWAGCFALAGADKTGGVAVVLVLEFVIAAATAFALYGLALSVLQTHPQGGGIALLAAALWYASPVSLPHTMNCLETGTYGLVVVLAVWAIVASSRAPGADWSVPRSVALGLVLGVVFWVRNDAVWLILAACLVRVGSGLRGGRASLIRRLTETCVMGGASVLVALPWLISNKIRFGHIVPISGVSEAIKSHVGVNLPNLPVPLAEYLMVVLPVPKAFETHKGVIAFSLVIIVGMLAAAIHCWRRGDTARRTLIAVVGLYALGLLGFYGLYFGAGYFLNRYLFPLSTFSALLGTATLLSILSIEALRRTLVRNGFLSILFFAVVGLNVRLYRNGHQHQHFQVVEWVQSNVPSDSWIAAVQTGTLGFFHDQTINLDGKVNPEALRIRLTSNASGGILQYVLDKNVEYLADWVGIAQWQRSPELQAHFEVVVEDVDRNLGVLRRNTRIVSAVTLPGR